MSNLKYFNEMVFRFGMKKLKGIDEIKSVLKFLSKDFEYNSAVIIKDYPQYKYLVDNYYKYKVLL